MPDEEIPDWDRANRAPHDTQFWRACMEDLFGEVMRLLTGTNSNKAPITKMEWVLFRATRSAVVSKIDTNSGFWPSQRYPLDRVGKEFSYNDYVRRWKQRSLKSGEDGRGVSIEGNELYVYTGVRRGLTRERIDVIRDIGPWNAEARRMIGELRDYVGEPAIWQIAGVGTHYPRIMPPPLLELVRTASKQELLQPALPARPSLSEAQLARARKVVNECRSSGIHAGPTVR